MRKYMTALITKIRNKLSENAGESIVETLVSMLITVLAFMMLAGAIVASARVNAGVEGHTLFVNEADADPNTNKEISASVTIVRSTGATLSTSKKVKTYSAKDASGKLYYYE